MVELRVAEPGPLGLTFAVLEAADGGPTHDFDVRLITGDPTVLAAASSDALLGSALGGLELDDTLKVTSVGAANAGAPGEQQHACRTVDGVARTLVIGDYSIALFDKEVFQRGSGEPIVSYSIGELSEWGTPEPEVPGQEEPYIFVTAAGGAGLKLRVSDPHSVCQSIMENATKLAQLNRKHGGGKKKFLSQLRNATEIGWRGGARVGQRLVAINGTAVDSVASVAACFKDDMTEDSGSWVTTMTLRSGPIVIGSVDPGGTATQAEPDRLQCGLRLLAINGQPTAGRSFAAMTKQIREDPRPLLLQLGQPPAPPPQTQQQQSPVNSETDPEVSDGDRAMLKHVEAAQIEHVSNGMVQAKRDNVGYEAYLREMMPDDYNHEFVTFERKNERYHAMWDTLTAESELTHKYTDPETNRILDVDAIAADSSIAGAGAGAGGEGGGADAATDDSKGKPLDDDE